MMVPQEVTQMEAINDQSVIVVQNR